MSALKAQTEPPMSDGGYGQDARSARTRSLVAAALLTAIMAASGWVSIPIPGAVPVTLQIFGVVLAALLLAPQWASASMAVYVLLGAVGVPIYAGGQGGLGVLSGPTGGYLTGFVLAAYLGALMRTRVAEQSRHQLSSDIAASVVVILVVYSVGWAQLALVLHLAPLPAFVAGVAPFLVPDVIKAAIAIVIATAVRRAIQPV